MPDPNQLPPFKAERTLLGVAVEPEQKEEVEPERFPGFTDGEVSATDPDIQWDEQRVVGGDREVFQHVAGQSQFSGGSWTLNPFDGWPIAFVFGGEEVFEDDPSEGLTRHVITARQDGPPPTVTAEYVYIPADGQDALVRPFVGVFATSGEISQNNEGMMQFSVDNEALGLPDDIYSDGPRTSFITDAEWLPNRKPWRFQDASSKLTLFGTEFARVTEFSVSTETGSQGWWYVEDEHSPEPFEAAYGNTTHSWNVTINVSDASLFNELVNHGEDGFNAEISFDKQFEPDESLTIKGEGGRIESAPHNIPEEGPISVSVSMVFEHLEIEIIDTQSDGVGYLEPGTPIVN